MLRIVIFIALTVPVLRYAVAFQQVEPTLDFYGIPVDISVITGLAFGVSYEAAIFLGIEEATAARKRGNGKWWWPLVGALAQATVGMFIVLPVIVAGLRDVPLPNLLDSWWAWLWSGVVAASTLLTFATVSLVTAVKPKPRAASSTASQKPRFVCDVCSYKAKSQQALNAHQRIHSDGKRVAETAELRRTG